MRCSASSTSKVTGPFDELDRMSLGIVAEHLAVAIHNARLIEQSQRLAVLEERQRLARELHDNVTQILSSISLMAQSLDRRLAQGSAPTASAAPRGWASSRRWRSARCARCCAS